MKIIALWILFALLVPAYGSTQVYRYDQGAESAVSSLENINGIKGKGALANKGAKGSAFTKLASGDSIVLLDADGAGIIQRMWFTIDDRSGAMLRGLRLRMYWDHSSTAAVDVPFGDFFCLGAGKMVAFENEFFSTVEGRSFNCYIPMPFKSGARITLTNGSGKDLSLLFLDIDFVRTAKKKKNDLYFHATYNRTETTAIGEDVTIIPTTKGKGRFLGTSIAVNVNPAYGDTWWGEGEVKMWLDGDTTHPSIAGTGTEDYIGTGWFMGKFTNRYQGCTVADKKEGKYTFYRFHIPDAILFHQNFRASLQQIGGWYAKDVKALQAKGVALHPVSLYGKKGFRGLFDPKTPADELKNAADDDWLNFYRNDDYAVTAYYYLNRP